MLNPPKIGTLGVAVSSVWKGQNSCGSRLNPKESQIKYIFEVTESEVFGADYQLSQQGEEYKPEIPYLALRDNGCSVLVLSLCGHCREL